MFELTHRGIPLLALGLVALGLLALGATLLMGLRGIARGVRIVAAVDAERSAPAGEQRRPGAHRASRRH